LRIIPPGAGFEARGRESGEKMGERRKAKGTGSFLGREGRNRRGGKDE